MNLQNKVVLITGSGSGLGKSLALKVAAIGAQVVLVARTENELKQAKDEIEKKGGKAEYFVCDITDGNKVKQTATQILQKYNSIDILVNNAGIWTDEELEKNDPNLRRRALEVNVLGTIQFTYAFLPHFQEKNSGYIFNVISSAGASDTPAGNNALWKTYGASKWAMTGFTKSLRDALVGTKIKITAFHPGGFESMLYEKAKRKDAHNQPWMMKTDDVADVIIFALTRPENMMMEKIIVTKI